jgi:predicted GIY-YIG superfamily endonuclease
MNSFGRVNGSERTQARLVRLLQAVMVLILGIGLYSGNVGVAFNAAIGLLVTQLPALLERRYQITMNVGLVLWITLAMFLHALGTVPLPGADFGSLYGSTWWWDHMTHALSSSLVVGSAYAVTRAVQEHTEHIHMGPKFTLTYLLVFVMAFGVFWELIEFYIAVGAELLGIPRVLTQYGLEDTILDLVYNSIGGLLVAIFGTTYLTGISDQLRTRLELHQANR